MLDEMTRQNASKFAIFYIYENPKLLFPFFISCNFTFFRNQCQSMTTLFRNERFMLDEMTQQNISKFAIFLEYEILCTYIFFRFSFRATIFFSPDEYLGLRRHRTEKLLGFSYSKNMPNFEAFL